MRLTRTTLLLFTSLAALQGCGASSVVPVEVTVVPPRFSACGNIECSTITVPVDRTGTVKGDVELGVYRRKGSATPTQPLVVHPGGPGADVKELVEKIDQFLGADVEKFDVIGLATRGTPDVSPVTCVKDLDDIVSAATSDSTAMRVAEGCKSAALVGHSSTLDTVNDLEQLKTALGLPQVDYLGWSYGATIGATWMMTHPTSLHTVVLDAPADPGLPWAGQLRSTLQAQQENFSTYLRGCGASPGCEFGTDPLVRVKSLVARTDPVKVGLALELSMYDADLGKFARALVAAAEGDPTSLNSAANARLGRAANGTDDGGMEAQLAVQCSDVSHADAANAVSTAESFTPSTIRIGLGAALDRVCLHLPEPATPLGRVSAMSGARNANVLVVATRLDAASPAWVSLSLASRMGWGTYVVDAAVHLAVGFDRAATTAALGCLLQSICH